MALAPRFALVIKFGTWITTATGALAADPVSLHQICEQAFSESMGRSLMTRAVLDAAEVLALTAKKTIGPEIAPHSKESTEKRQHQTSALAEIEAWAVERLLEPARRGHSDTSSSNPSNAGGIGFGKTMRRSEVETLLARLRVWRHRLDHQTIDAPRIEKHASSIEVAHFRDNDISVFLKLFYRMSKRYTDATIAENVLEAFAESDRDSTQNARWANLMSVFFGAKATIDLAKSDWVLGGAGLGAALLSQYDPIHRHLFPIHYFRRKVLKKLQNSSEWVDGWVRKEPILDAFNRFRSGEQDLVVWDFNPFRDRMASEKPAGTRSMYLVLFRETLGGTHFFLEFGCQE